LLLLRQEFAGDRGQIDQLLAQAYKQAEHQTQIDPGVLTDLGQRVTELQRRLSALARELGNRATWLPTEYIDATHFLGQFQDALRILQQNDGAEFFTGKIRAKGKTVGELVKYMTVNGLYFAAATGNERYYVALHRHLVSYVGEVVGGANEKARVR
jgi:hypothetical protein